MATVGTFALEAHGVMVFYYWWGQKPLHRTHMIQLIPSKNDVFIFTERLGSFGREFHYFGTVESFLCPPLKKKEKLSTYFHFLFFQPVGVVIMEHRGVTDNCAVPSACGQPFLLLLNRRAEPARSSLLTLVSRGRARLRPPAFSRARFNQNIPERGDGRCPQPGSQCGHKVFFSS